MDPSCAAAPRIGSAAISHRLRLAKRLVWIAPIVAFLFSFVIELGMVPTASMEGTVLVGDHLLVLKLPYGPNLPFTHYRLPQLRVP